MSLRSRLVIVLGLLLATYVVAALAILSTQRSLLIEQVDQRLIAMQPNVITRVGAPPPDPAGQGAPPPGEEMGDSSLFSDLFVGVAQVDGAVSPLVTGLFLKGTPDIKAAVTAAEGPSDIVTVGATDGPDRYRALVVSQPDGAWVVVAQPLAEIDVAVGRLQRTLWIAGGVIVIVLGLAFFWIQRLGLRPIARVTATAEAIAAGDRSRRAAVADERTEAGKLARAFNIMLDQRDAAEDRLRQFVADASHELRTPLTSIRGYLDLYRQGAFRDEGQLDDVVRRLSAESARMHRLVEDLLALASLDEGRPLRIEAIDVGQLLRDAAQDARAAQPDRPIAVEAPDRGPSARGDGALLAQLVGILVSNALTHTPATAPLTLTASTAGTTAVIAVADRGPGLEPAVAERVFDRFWRGERSRNRAQEPTTAHRGGAGLGLAIARSITGAHSGTITLDTSPGNGCIFTIQLPLAQLPKR